MPRRGRVDGVVIDGFQRRQPHRTMTRGSLRYDTDPLESPSQSRVTGTARVIDDTVTVTVTTEAQLQMLRLVGGDTVTFDATATVEAVKVETP